eukprot:8052615-Pyramimonas_sp.AAC.1
MCLVSGVRTAKLVVFLTLPVDPTGSNVVEQNRVLQLMKSAFLDGETSTVIVSMIAEPLSRFEEYGRMDETDTKIVQLILTLFRNLLCIPDSLHSSASAGDHMTHLKVCNATLESYRTHSTVLITDDGAFNPSMGTPARGTKTLLPDIAHRSFNKLTYPTSFCAGQPAAAFLHRERDGGDLAHRSSKQPITLQGRAYTWRGSQSRYRAGHTQRTTTGLLNLYQPAPRQVWSVFVVFHKDVS